MKDILSDHTHISSKDNGTTMAAYSNKTTFILLQHLFYFIAHRFTPLNRLNETRKQLSYKIVMFEILRWSELKLHRSMVSRSMPKWLHLNAGMNALDPALFRPILSPSTPLLITELH